MAASNVYGRAHVRAADASNFPGPFSFDAIGFFQDDISGGLFASGTFIFELSATSKPVDGLDTVDFDSNVTGPVHSFATLILNGGR